MCRLKDLGRDERRQGYGNFHHKLNMNNVPSEFSGTLTGFDDYVNMVLENVTEL